MTTPKSQKSKDASPTLIDLIRRYPTPEAARAYLEAVRWPDGPVCPYCGVVNEAARLEGAAHDKGLWWCRSCSHNFTVTVDSIFHDSHLPLDKWVIAYHLISANKKGISTASIARMLGISYKSTWHMVHRIRETLRDNSLTPLGGSGAIVEVDETWIGGKEKNKHRSKRRASEPFENKTPVVALVQRGGRVHARAITNVDDRNIAPILKAKLASGTLMMTDEAVVYSWHARKNPDHVTHKTVNHKSAEYVRVEADGFKAHTQTVESFNAVVKRCIIGAWHNVSDRHLDRYLDEICFRWNTRDMTDGQRMEVALKQSEGRRLTLRELV